ncbi:hypothetical protein Bra3105_06795 [Brachybacterium halotolerans subsp. kimchii]|uniref:hypothetical protein n=1 Tax=Brachybacterium halotolerans TaxID=2795215 RepID=UPI001E4797ED|nr:hypothetical protein [Brachybacterium halotolerans]UEJ84014.1 hypothetical protein Bra3105_06795 [Brachybacterium halotolerans subsp. kimchii]
MPTKAPQDHKSPAKKNKKIAPHDPSEMFVYDAPHSGVTVTLPYTENLPSGAIRRAQKNAGDNEMAFYFAILEELLEDDFEDTVDPLLQREIAEMIKRWEGESATELGESSAS